MRGMNEHPPQDDARRAQRRLIEAAQHGDPYALHELIRRYEPLVHRVVRKLRLPPWCERADLEQEARLGLLRAIRGWQPERGPFPAFADCCVRRQALLALKTVSARKHQVLGRAATLDAPPASTANPAPEASAPTTRDSLAAPRDPRTDPEAHLLMYEQLRTLARARATLTPTERAGLAIALNDESFLHPPATFPGTPKAASQAAYRARRKLAAALAQAA
jgi:RNA polymerase sigma factor (sigma-70 family)